MNMTAAPCGEGGQKRHHVITVHDGLAIIERRSIASDPADEATTSAFLSRAWLMSLREP